MIERKAATEANGRYVHCEAAELATALDSPQGGGIIQGRFSQRRVLVRQDKLGKAVSSKECL